MYRTFSGLNEKDQLLSERKRKANEIIVQLKQKPKTCKFDFPTKWFLPTIAQSTLLTDLIEEYLSVKQKEVVKFTFANYSTIFKAYKRQYKI